MTTAAGRLQKEVDRKFPSWHSFQAALPKGVRGTSYGSVHNYLSGKRTPSLEFLQAAASVLEVRLEWLRDGTGGRTAVADLTIEMSKALHREHEIQKGLREDLDSEILRLDQVVGLQLMRLCYQWSVKEPPIIRRHGITEDDLADEGETRTASVLLSRTQELKRMLHAPLDAWGVSPDDIDFTEYAIAMLHALSLAMPRGQQVKASS